MLVLAIILFLIAAVFGFAILIAILQDRPPNSLAKYLHGIFAALALIIFIVYRFTYMAEASILLNLSIILLILAALGGLTMFTLDRKNKPIPKFIAIIHPIVAVSGLVALIIYILP